MRIWDDYPGRGIPIEYMQVLDANMTGITIGLHNSDDRVFFMGDLFWYQRGSRWFNDDFEEIPRKTAWARLLENV
jgi:hypothetical protein